MTAVRRLTSPDRRAIGLMLLLSAALSGIVMLHQFATIQGDYLGHVEVAIRLAVRGVVDNPHILFNLLIVIIARVFPFLGYVYAGVIASMFSYVLGAVVVYITLRSAVLERGRTASFLTLIFAMCLLIVAPISIVTLPQQNLYFGYIAINVLHNPTILLLKPFALLVFGVAVQMLRGEKPFGNRTLFVTVLLVALCVFAKPVYLMGLLPALMVFVAYRLLRHEKVETRTLLLGILIPTMVLLALQYIYAYYFSEFIGDSNIVFAPLAVMQIYEPSIPWLIVKFALSILFPLCVYVLYFKETRKDLALNLAGLSFIFAAVQMYLFAETGWRTAGGNFWWGAQITLFVLFIASTMFLLRQASAWRDWRFWLCGAVFTIHLISGIVYYWVCGFSPNASVWMCSYEEYRGYP